jgi:hypothetical protein
VTGLGFAAAGIAFALQNVILAMAGYFSMVAPNGIRVGDRVSLQGPFGYVQGEVLDIGLVRIRLRELDGSRSARRAASSCFPTRSCSREAFSSIRHRKIGVRGPAPWSGAPPEPDDSLRDSLVGDERGEVGVVFDALAAPSATP